MFVFHCQNCGADVTSHTICPRCGAHLEDKVSAIQRNQRHKKVREFNRSLSSFLSIPIEFFSRFIPKIGSTIEYHSKAASLPFYIGLFFTSAGTTLNYLFGDLTLCLTYLFSSIFLWFSIVCIWVGLDCLNDFAINKEISGYYRYFGKEPINTAKAYILWGTLFSVGSTGATYAILSVFSPFSNNIILIISMIILILSILAILYAYHCVTFHSETQKEIYYAHKHYNFR